VAPSTAVYGELLSARSFAGTLLGRSAPRQRPDHTFDLARWRRDDRRREDGYPPS